MKLGLITDIHESTEHLRTALSHFEAEKVDQIVQIGDLFELGQRIEETCQLLRDAKVIGVWGNHDFGLCINPAPDMRKKHGDVVIEYMTSLQPRIEVAGCYFAHVEPWLNPEELMDLWFFDGPPNDSSRLERIFNAVPNRLMFGGHYHRWLLVSPGGISEWDGECPISLTPGRFFVVIGALCEGSYAILDTDSSELVPFNLSSDGQQVNSI